MIRWLKIILGGLALWVTPMIVGPYSMDLVRKLYCPGNSFDNVVCSSGLELILVSFWLVVALTTPVIYVCSCFKVSLYRAVTATFVVSFLGVLIVSMISGLWLPVVLASSVSFCLIVAFCLTKRSY